MKKSTILLMAFLILVTPLLGFVLPAKANSNRLIVPDDYPTLSSAIGNATAGDTILIKKGTYEEQTLEITKPLTIIGEETNSTIITLHPPIYNVTHILTTSYANLTSAITVNANDFNLLNLTITLNPGGFLLVNGERAKISGNILSTGGTPTGLIIAGSFCNITNNYAIGIERYDTTTNAYVYGPGGSGFISSNGQSNTVTENFCSKIIASGDLNKITANSISTLELSQANQNTAVNNKIGAIKIDNYGISLSNSSNNILYGNTISASLYNIALSGASENNQFYHNNFLNISLYKDVRVNLSLANTWDSTGEGNYWQDYNGTDANGDGIGDTPYVIDHINVDRYPLINPWTGSLPTTESWPFTTLLIASVIIAVALGIILLLFGRKKRV